MGASELMDEQLTEVRKFLESYLLFQIGWRFRFEWFWTGIPIGLEADRHPEGAPCLRESGALEMTVAAQRR